MFNDVNQPVQPQVPQPAAPQVPQQQPSSAPQPPQQPPPSMPQATPADMNISGNNVAFDMPGQGSSSKKGDFLFKLIVILAIISVLALLGALGYYLYTNSQLSNPQSAAEPQVSVNPPPVTSPTAVPGAVLSESDDIGVTESELNQTELGEFETELTSLLEQLEQL